MKHRLFINFLCPGQVKPQGSVAPLLARVHEPAHLLRGHAGFPVRECPHIERDDLVELFKYVPAEPSVSRIQHDKQADSVHVVSCCKLEEGSNAGFSFICILLCSRLTCLAGRNFANPLQPKTFRFPEYL